VVAVRQEGLEDVGNGHDAEGCAALLDDTGVHGGVREPVGRGVAAASYTAKVAAHIGRWPGGAM
jgi:hypothetical protein